MNYPEELITSDVCLRCGSCCKLTVSTKSASDRSTKKQKEKTVEWYNVIARQTDTIEIYDDGRIRFHCPQLLKTSDGMKTCQVYKDRPKICSDYNCFHMANLKGRPPENYEMIKGIIKKVHGEDAI